jgi:hypothetical protein
VNRARARRAVLAAMVLAVVAVVIAGLRIVGSPGAQRIRRLDERRVNDLQAIANAVDAYWTQKKTLPRSLDELTPVTRLTIPARDPVDDVPYVYRAGEADRYELCATFEGDTNAENPRAFWTHPAGQRCFQLTAGTRTR